MTSEIKVGDKVRTADPLTAGVPLSPSERAPRRAGTRGEVKRHCFGLWWAVVHEDGTEAPYAAEELTPRVFDPDGLPVGEDPPPDTRQANRAGWAALSLNGGVWIEDPDNRENHLLQEVARLREVEAVKLPAIEAVLDKHRAAFGVTLPQAPQREALTEQQAPRETCLGCAKVARHPGEGYACAAHPPDRVPQPVAAVPARPRVGGWAQVHGNTWGYRVLLPRHGEHGAGHQWTMSRGHS